MAVSDTGIDGARDFPATCWSAIRHARDVSGPEAQPHLARLVELYWKPVYCVIRHARAASVDDAKDLTQEFFAAVVLGGGLIERSDPARGSFRALLRTALNGFLVDRARSAGRQKRGGGAPPLPLDPEGDAGHLLGDAQGLTPDQMFDLAWTRAVFGDAVAELERRLAAAGRAPRFEAFRRFYLEPHGAAAGRPSYAAVGEALGLTPVQVKHALVEARAELRAVLIEAVREYVDGPEDLARELRALLGA